MMESSVAARESRAFRSRATTFLFDSRWLGRTHERADDLSIDLTREGFGIQAGAFQEGSRVVRRVHTRNLDVDLLEAGFAKKGPVLSLFERSGDASDPELHVLSDGTGNFATYDDVAHREPSPGLEDAERLTQHLPFVGRQVDHTVGDDHVDRCVGQRDAFDLSLQKGDVRGASPSAILLGESRTSMPPPEPRSRTVSPSFSSASAVGLPQPNDASNAVAGMSAVCASSYRSAV